MRKLRGGYANKIIDPTVGDIVTIVGENGQQYTVMGIIHPNTVIINKTEKNDYLLSELNLITAPPSPAASELSSADSPSEGDLNISGSLFSNRSQSLNTTKADESGTIEYDGRFSEGGKKSKRKRKSKRKFRWNNKASIAVVATTMAIDNDDPVAEEPVLKPDPAGGKKKLTRKKPYSLKKRVR